MSFNNSEEDFGQKNFPPVPAPGSEITGTQELYPENLQDEINEYYVHDKVLPRIKGKDYVGDESDSKTPEEVSTFPHKY